MIIQNYSDEILKLRREIEALKAERDALRRDAERWQEARKHFRILSADMGSNHAWAWHGTSARLRGPSIDAAIDAAMGRQAPE